MEPRQPAFDPVRDRFGPRWQLGMVVLFNSVIALLLIAAAGDRYGSNTLWLMFVYSQCIGLSIYSATHAMAWLAHRPGAPQPRDLIPGILIGAVVGSLIGGVFTGRLDLANAGGWGHFGANVFLGIVFGVGAGYAYFATLRNAQSHFELKQQEMQRLTAEKQLVETRLRLLQAQIEPHFLFNTLSNIHSLIETRPERAARMLDALTLLLRASLKRSREGKATLADELALVRAYLEIQRERMGERLGFTIDAPEALHPLPFPPMLIQPLVENAVHHGLEPAVGGGTVAIQVTRAEDWLRVEVSDTGLGFGQESTGHGVGLQNVGERLRSLFGTDARLSLEQRRPTGIRAVMLLPVESAVTGTGDERNCT